VDQQHPAPFKGTAKAPDWAFITCVHVEKLWKVTYDKKPLSQVIPFETIFGDWEPFSAAIGKAPGKEAEWGT
jgi:hypothetical protein